MNNILRNLAYKSLLDLATTDGINASGKEEIYGCIFGRDSALTILKILRVHAKSPSLDLLEISRKSLLTLVGLQGKFRNIESGEEPGKYIHEYRREKSQYSHLLKIKKPWYLYEDKTLKNYDSIDSTPLTLIAIYKYWQATEDNEFLLKVIKSVEDGLNWIITMADPDGDNFIEYELPKLRKFGGLTVQSWTDSTESLLQKDGTFPKYPIAPVEVQAYAWLALRLWADFYKKQNLKYALKLLYNAKYLKKMFNRNFILKDCGLHYAGQALDGDKKLIKTITGNPVLALWATYQNGSYRESIVANSFIPDFISRVFTGDLFDPDAGIRTMSADAETYNPNQDSYHNGSFWPILNGLAHEGLEYWGYRKEADLLKKAALKPIAYFGTPIELYVKKTGGEYLEYVNSHGQKSCKVQAWSAAATLDLLTD